MSSIFSKIVSGDIPSYKVAEDDDYLAFLDINPLARGHVLVIPKKEVDYIFDLDPDALAGLMRFAQRVARAIESVVECERIGVAVIGLEVPHAHIHLVPLRTMYDIDFTKERVQLSREQFESLARAISERVV